ncbi:glyoxalase I [Violaceomyces palustris]|uniref:Glyoxalase I n=1 Tax=Violaceomyces palustris TaxID=1673888 RepID=A0ACD0P869_9BASI|nr:glyoxalase I [Violaceomyces palustris]
MPKTAGLYLSRVMGRTLSTRSLPSVFPSWIRLRQPGSSPALLSSPGPGEVLAAIRNPAFSHSHTRVFSSSPVPRFLLTSVNLMPQTAETASYRFNHTMIRVKDPKVSLDFYENVLGMDLIDTHNGGDFTLYFLAYSHQDGKSRGEREAILELTHNHGTENDASFAYHNGNQEPKGFGHLAISVDDLEAACERFEKLGVKFQKRLKDGKMHNIAFILDPDNYWIEVISTKRPQ